MKSTTNVFLEGLRTDLHPLSTGQQYLTDALNATMLTYNGNEMMLQNDMGNTRILDSATGNIMGLNPGFIPIGMKEHGGIMYITSVNKDGYGEIGTIPSPIIRDIYKDKIFYNVDKSIPIGVGDPITITNKLYPADKFIANLLMGIEESLLKGIKYKKLSQSGNEASDPCNIILGRECLILTSVEPDPDSGLSGNFGQAASTSFTTIYSPVISYASDSNSKIEIEGGRNINVQKKGIYNLNLYSTSELGKNTLAGESLLSSQMYNEGTSQYWFLHTDDPLDHFPKDLFNATLNKSLKQVPVSSKPGRLAVKLIPETIKTFGMLPRQEDPFNTPITYKKDGLYYTFFPGFYYSTDNGLYVETIDAKVIDESTNKEIDLVYPFGSNKPFSRYDLNGLSSKILLGSLFTGKLWEPNNDGFPHTLSSVQEDAEYKTFIISPIAGIYDHTKTNFKSSTEAENEHPHAGLFYAKLGDKYNNWYRLEVTYKDLYDGNEGTFTTRFNPYLNDVFGTNLCVKKIEQISPITIGAPNRFELGYEVKFLPQTQYSILATIDGPNVGIEKYLERNGLYTDWSTPYSTLGNTDCTLTFESITSEKILHIDKRLIQNYPESYKYFYLEQSITGDLHRKKALTHDLIGTGLGTLKLREAIDDDVYFVVGNSVDSDHRTISDKFEMYSVNDTNRFYQKAKGMTNVHTTVLDSFTIGEWTTKFHSKDLNYNTTWVLATSNKIDYSVTTERNINFPDITVTHNWPDTIGVEDTNLKLTSDPLSLKGGLGGIRRIDSDEFVYSDSHYATAQRNRKTWGYGKTNVGTSGCEDFDFLVTKTYDLWGVSNVYTGIVKATPSYSITPYFLLQGQNDSGETVCVQRFNGMTYEHNLTEVSIEQLTETSLESKPCSYNELNSFKYYSDVTNSNTYTLNPGLYVLNIQRCPGVGNWTQNGTTSLVNLKIKMEDVEKLIENWSFTGVDSNGYEYEEHKGVDTSNMRAYIPIVMYVPEAGEITISIEGQKIGDVAYTFNRQSMGLYKLNITDEQFGEDKETLNKLFSDGVFLYKDYMNKVYDHAVTTYQEDKVKQYNFIQTYGAFFKEAFVFVDGLLDEENKSVNSVTIGDKTYRPYPYIPNDPSILPFGYNNGKYIWNTYYMTKEVLDGGGAFKFSNASPNDISTTNLLKSLESITGDNSLRQLITQSEE